MKLRRKLKEIAHRRGWVASPSLAFLGVPFGPDRRDLAAEVTPGTIFVDLGSPEANAVRRAQLIAHWQKAPAPSSE